MSEGEPAGPERAKSWRSRRGRAYEAGSDRPVGSFLAIMGGYLGGVVGNVRLCRYAGRRAIGTDDQRHISVIRPGATVSRIHGYGLP